MGIDKSLTCVFPILVHSTAQKFKDKSFSHKIGCQRVNKIFNKAKNKHASENLSWGREKLAVKKNLCN